ncbi:MAG: MafI family immunity protein [Planctomycetaceae bacterium]
MPLESDCIALSNQALEAVRSRIPDDLFRGVHDYINRFNEWGVGMKMLIDQISEYEIKITVEQFDLIHAAMISMHLGDSDRLRYLRAHDVIA